MQSDNADLWQKKYVVENLKLFCPDSGDAPCTYILLLVNKHELNKFIIIGFRIIQLFIYTLLDNLLPYVQFILQIRLKIIKLTTMLLL